MEKYFLLFSDILLEDELFILPRYKPKDMAKLASTTQFAKHELRKIYQGFKQVNIDFD